MADIFVSDQGTGDGTDPTKPMGPAQPIPLAAGSTLWAMTDLPKLQLAGNGGSVQQPCRIRPYQRDQVALRPGAGVALAGSNFGGLDLAGIVFQGGGPTTPGTGLMLDGSFAGLRIADCELHDFGVTNPWDQGDKSDATGSAIALKGGNYGDVQDVQLTRVKITGSQKNAVFMFGVRNWTFTGLTLADSLGFAGQTDTGAGITASECEDGQVLQSSFTGLASQGDPAGSPIMGIYSYRIRVQGCTFRKWRPKSVDGFPVCWDDSTDCFVLGCLFEDCMGNAMGSGPYDGHDNPCSTVFAFNMLLGCDAMAEVLEWPETAGLVHNNLQIGGGRPNIGGWQGGPRGNSRFFNNVLLLEDQAALADAIQYYDRAAMLANTVGMKGQGALVPAKAVDPVAIYKAAGRDVKDIPKTNFFGGTIDPSAWPMGPV